MTTPQIAAVVIFLAVIVAIMTEKIHRAVAATAGTDEGGGTAGVLCKKCVKIRVKKLFTLTPRQLYRLQHGRCPDRYDAVRCSGKKFRHL